MVVEETVLPGVLLLTPSRYEDGRGYFEEVWHRRRFAEAGLPVRFAQDNVSFSRQGVLRGLHFQQPSPQGKLITVLSGEVFDVVVDLRRSRPTFGQWLGLRLSSAEGRQLYVPEGLAHGFCVTSETALFQYKCTEFYAPACEHTIRWNDPALGIDWPVAEPLLSEKDATAPLLEDLPEEALPA